MKLSLIPANRADAGTSNAGNVEHLSSTFLTTPKALNYKAQGWYFAAYPEVWNEAAIYPEGVASMWRINTTLSGHLMCIMYKLQECRTFKFDIPYPESS
jgi:hypothetical protein